MEEAHQRQRSRPRSRRQFGFVFGAGLGLAGLAMVALVLLSVIVPGRAQAVTVRASVQGNPRVPVTQAIQLSFNQPMQETQVAKGLSISPAVTFQAKWPDPTTLVIAPRHQLVPNVSYVVTIARQDARAQDGAMPLSKVVIPFGTEPLNATASGYPPSLVTVDQLATAQGAQGLEYSPNGELLPTLSGPAAGAVYQIGASPSVIASGATNPVASPDSQQLAFWSVAASGTATLDVAPLAGGGQPTTLAASSAANPEAAWLNDSSLLYADQGQLQEVNLDGQTNPVFSWLKLGPNQSFSVEPAVHALFARPAGLPTVYNLASGSSSTIPGLQGNPQWSPTGGQMAYVGSAGGVASIYLAGTYGSQPRQLLVAPAGVSLTGLRYSPDGQYLAYQATSPRQGTQAGAVDIATGASALLSTRAGLSHLAWSPFGNALAALQQLGSGQQAVVTMELSSPPGTSSSSGRAGRALDLASNLAQLQITDSPTAAGEIAQLLAPHTVIPSSTLLPGPFDRFYAVSSTPTSAGGTTYQVAIELVTDATATQPATALQEQVTVAMGGATPQISGITLGSVTALPVGPLVVSANAQASQSAGATFSLQFNSDLNPLSVSSQSISLQDSGQPVSGLQISYQAATRTVVVITGPLSQGPLVLTVQAPLSDVNHVQMAVPYTLSLPTAPTQTAGSGSPPSGG
ncbi:MAG: TolB family protein [Candidatus Dormibacteria bacterium]